MTDFADMLNGYRRFRQTGWQQQRERWDELRDGQSPKVMIIACSDSRVDPTQIFDTNPGETFVVRNVAALVPPYEQTPGHHGVSAALEFAVQVLGVSEILVMGHGLCGGCNAALTQELKDAPRGAGGFVADWIRMLDEPRARVLAHYGHDHSRDAQRAMENEAVRLSLTNLRTFPWIAEKEAAGTLRLIGARFAISDGVLHILDEASGEFAPA
ncbi:carbonic anhydrase [Sphingobium subterraneum]|uniref:Carbonic anhydrase n=1 Tax=Sphingobium subterraneum TaxID=627688 RepID=A0A841J2K6_9SPHN|nr:carbonic anhydrase [Sphingobium subterraneum]MBB6122551.1 carbonic anhydrase [Sphingobium subterraneum]